jgi:hypothetical protein
MRMCFACGAQLQSRQRVPFKELCPECDAFMHCCKNCRLYSPESHNHCLSPSTEFVPDVERGNYCDEFHFREIEDPNPREDNKRAAKPEKKSRSQALSAREKFEKLFKD